MLDSAEQRLCPRVGHGPRESSFGYHLEALILARVRRKVDVSLFRMGQVPFIVQPEFLLRENTPGGREGRSEGKYPSAKIR